MTKAIHIHIHRGPARDTLEAGKSKAAFSHNVATEMEAGKPQKQAVAIAYSKQRESGGDAWEESKHKRAANGQFGSGGGGAAAKPAAKSAPSAPVKKADNPQNVATQLAARKNQLKALQSEMKSGKYSPEDIAELKTKEASLKRMIANYESKSEAPRPVTANERKEPNQVRSDVIATINKRLDGPLTAQSKKELLEKKARLIAAQKPGAGPTSAAKPTKSLEAQARAHEEMAAKYNLAAEAEYKKNGKTDEYVRLKNLAQSRTNMGADLINQAVAASKQQAAPAQAPAANPALKSYEHYRGEFLKLNRLLESSHRTTEQRKELIRKRDQMRKLMGQASMARKGGSE